MAFKNTHVAIFFALFAIFASAFSFSTSSPAINDHKTNGENVFLSAKNDNGPTDVASLFEDGKLYIIHEPLRSKSNKRHVLDLASGVSISNEPDQKWGEVIRRIRRHIKEQIYFNHIKSFDNFNKSRSDSNSDVKYGFALSQKPLLEKNRSLTGLLYTTGNRIYEATCSNFVRRTDLGSNEIKQGNYTILKNDHDFNIIHIDNVIWFINLRSSLPVAFCTNKRGLSLLSASTTSFIPLDTGYGAISFPDLRILKITKTCSVLEARVKVGAEQPLLFNPSGCFFEFNPSYNKYIHHWGYGLYSFEHPKLGDEKFYCYFNTGLITSAPRYRTKVIENGKIKSQDTQSTTIFYDASQTASCHANPLRYVGPIASISVEDALHKNFTEFLSVLNKGRTYFASKLDSTGGIRNLNSNFDEEMYADAFQDILSVDLKNNPNSRF